MSSTSEYLTRTSLTCPGRSSRSPSFSVAGALFVFLLIATPVDAQWFLDGSVVDLDGNPVAGVDIDIVDPSGTELALSGDFTDATGTFSLSTVLVSPLIGLYEITLNPPVGTTFQEMIVPDVFLIGDTDLGEFVMRRELTFSGQVVDEAGIAIPGIDLEFFDETGVEVAMNNDDTDLGGFFSVLIPEGTWSVVFRQVTPAAVDYASFLFPEQSIRADLDLGALTMFEAQEVTGSVESAAGLPIAAVNLDVFDAATGIEIPIAVDSTDAGGVYAFTTPAIDIRIEFYPSTLGSAPGELEATIAAGVVNDLGVLTLVDAAVVSGRVVDDTLLGIAAVDLDFVDPVSGIAVLSDTDDTDAEGNFSVSIVPGTYDVELRPSFASGFAPTTIADQDLNASVDLGDVTLEAGLAVTGLATESDLPVAGVAVTLAHTSDGSVVTTFGNRTDADGQYAIRVAEGTYDVTFTPPVATGLSAITMTSLAILTDTVVDVAFGVTLPPLPVTSLTCDAVADSVTLTWVNGALDYESIDVQRNGVSIATLAGDATTLTDLAVPVGLHTYEVIASAGGLASVATACEAEVFAPPGAVGDLTCEATTEDITLAWSNVDPDYDALVVRRDGAELTTLAGSATEYLDAALPAGEYSYEVIAVRNALETTAPACVAEVIAVTAAPTDLVCSVIFDDITLTWTNGESDYDSVEVRRGGALLDTLAGDATEYTDVDVVGPMVTYDVRGVRAGVSSTDATCDAEVVEPQFLRGDVSGNGSLNGLLDAQFLLEWGFSGGPTPPCLDAADVDDNGTSTPLLDALFLLEYAFANQSPPPSPGPDECGPDPTPDTITCDSPPDLCN